MPLSHQIDRIPTRADPLHGPWRLSSRQRQTGSELPVALRERGYGQPEVLRAPGEIGTHEQVQELLRRFVGRGGADEQKIDKPLRFREPVQGPGTHTVIEAFERDMRMKPKGDATVEIWQRLRQAGSVPDRPTPRDAAGETSGGAGAAPPRSTISGDRSGVAGQSDLRQGSEPGIARQSGKQRTRASKPSHFTLGSHKDKVRRVQGEPDQRAEQNTATAAFGVDGPRGSG